MSKKEFNFVDLFAGCGGLSEGFYAQGFKALLHLDFDKYACETLKERMRYYGYPENEISSSVLCGDITSDDVMNKMKKQLHNKSIDVVAGGPPCQSFSSLGKAKDPYSMKYDKRNHLFENYIDVLNICKPKIFIFENVAGILSSKVNGELIINVILKRMKKSYKVCSDLKTIVLNAVNYGVPQVRERVIIIGVRKDISIDAEEVYSLVRRSHYGPGELPDREMEKYVSVEEAISDLPKLRPGEGSESVEYLLEKSNRYTSIIRNKKSKVLLSHVARTHNANDIERYKMMSRNGWTMTELYEKRPDLAHEKRRLFDNSYVVQRAELPGRTIIAHLYKDGNQFIHPDHTQSRTFTVREAARIQSFPDDFRFIGSRTQQYKQVGNAVPPLMAKQVAMGIKSALLKAD